MIVYTAHEIWKKIHYTNPQDLEESFNAETKFLKLKDIQDELEDHMEFYKDNEMLSNFLNSFYYGLEI